MAAKKPSKLTIIASKLSWNFASKLLNEGIYVIGFYYLIVAKGQASIRFQLSAGHKRAYLDKVIAIFI